MANPNTDTVLMAAIAQVLLPGTRIGSLGNPVVIEDEWQLARGRFPAVHIETDRQKHGKEGYNVWSGHVRFIIAYYDRWDKASARIDIIRKSIKADLEIIMANLQHDSSLSAGGTPLATSAYEFLLAPYKGELDDRTIPGLTLVKRTLRVGYNLLPYDA
jgi:hypothetical protein